MENRTLSGCTKYFFGNFIISSKMPEKNRPFAGGGDTLSDSKTPLYDQRIDPLSIPWDFFTDNLYGHAKLCLPALK